ncbi:hypothetical protein GCK72_025429 [Caenorhabditis remanei]|uniref:Uncharacterized protein n=1 Tax=Caenorhabditis remanei TaxID=31234 RepID=A0A6A5G2Q3_CAERE|nr:hypothetical protein GCK72_025429 [Caenorhabditis remanei]KAF1748962.1 hypothetical protein GCK72_025429 [Caenorhabditis remanei]
MENSVHESSSDECFRKRDSDDFETESDLDEEAMAQKAACKARFAEFYKEYNKRQRLLDTDSDDDDSSSDECFRKSDGDDFETESDLDEEAMAQKAACKARFNRMYAAFRKHVRENQSDSDDDNSSTKISKQKESEEKENRNGNQNKTIVGQKIGAENQFAVADDVVPDVDSVHNSTDTEQSKNQNVNITISDRVQSSANAIANASGEDQAENPHNIDESESDEHMNNNNGYQNMGIVDHQMVADHRLVEAEEVDFAEADVLHVDSASKPIDNKQSETQSVNINNRDRVQSSANAIANASGEGQAENPHNIDESESDEHVNNNNSYQNMGIVDHQMVADHRLVEAEEVDFAEAAVLHVDLVLMPIDIEQFETRSVSINNSDRVQLSVTDTANESREDQSQNPRNFMNLDQGSSGTTNILKHNDTKKTDPIPKKTIIKKRVSKKPFKDEDHPYRPPGEKIDAVHPKLKSPRLTRSRGDAGLSKGLSNEKKHKVSNAVQEAMNLFYRHHT